MPNQCKRYRMGCEMKLNFGVGFHLYVNCVSLHLAEFSCTSLRDLLFECFYCYCISLHTRICFMGFVFNFFLISGSFRCGIWKSATFNTDEIQMRSTAWLSNYQTTNWYYCALVYWPHAWLPCAANCISDADWGIEDWRLGDLLMFRIKMC